MSHRTLLIRAATEADVDAFARVFDLATPSWATSVALHRRRRAAPSTPANGIRLVATEAGEVVGAARANEALEALLPQPGLFNAKVAVAPGATGRGIGSALFAEVAAWIAAQGTRQVASWADLDDRRSLAIASHWGFGRRPDSVESPADLSDGEAWAWDYCLPLDALGAPALAALAVLPGGVAVCDLAECLADGRLLASLHEAHEECRADVPSWEAHQPTALADFAEAQRQRLADGGAGLVAHEEGVVLAATFADRAAFVPVLDTDFTMVRPRARGRRLGLSLKARLAAWALAEGFEAITTEVRSDNPPMLAINAALGFRRIAMRHLVRGADPGPERAP